MHLINFKELSGQQLGALVDLGIEVKRNPKKYLKAFEGKSAALIFHKTSTRTRVAFEVAMTQLGGHGLFIDWRTTNFTLADIYDETQYLSRNVDCIMARLLKNADLQRMAEASRVPVINGCDEKYHPSQAIADLITMKEKGLGKTTLDAKKAVKDADFVYTDTWIDMEFFTDPKFAGEKEKRLKLMMPYQINKELLNGSDAYLMHDMPIHRVYEISGDVIEDPRSVIYEQSENRLYSAKAILDRKS